MATTAISAPGKVLLAGGYLVVDRAYTGLVFGLSARIHVIVKSLQLSQNVPVNEFVVRSPQFVDAEWRYGYRVVEEDGGIEVFQLKRWHTHFGDHAVEVPRNKFVETALGYVLSYISANRDSRLVPAVITILADDDYYSQSHTSSKCASNESSQFQNFNVTLGDAHKTGLGSSAALVTALTASLLAHYIPRSYGGTHDDAWRHRVHNLAQAAHCTAQGKVGSGFDIAAAVFGSCIYKRFSPAILETIGTMGTKGFIARLKAVVDETTFASTWDTQIQAAAVKMPKALRLVMCDVDCGSETPGMVRKVFAWRKEKTQEALLLWETLQKGNEDLAHELERLSVSSTPASFEGLAAVILTIRSLIREMSNKAGVPIEPKAQTELLDACSQLPGVVGGVVPGAGGYDALALIIEDGDEVTDRLSSFLDNYKANVAGDDIKTGEIRLLGAKQEMQGLVMGSQAMYKGWIPSSV